jgi:hypothetical protein
MTFTCPVCLKEWNLPTNDNLPSRIAYCSNECYGKSQKYKSLAVKDKYGNTIGYRSTTTGEMVEWTGAASPEFQRIFALSEQAIVHDKLEELVENPEFLEIV